MTIFDTCCLCFTGAEGGDPNGPSHWTILRLPGIKDSYNPGILHVGGSYFIWAICEPHTDDLISGGQPLTRIEVEVAMVMAS